MNTMNNYSTHLPLLIAACHMTKGPVLELGAGLYSTPVLSQMLVRRGLVSLDTSAEWVKQMLSLGIVRDPRHQIRHVTNWSEVNPTIWKVAWSVVFVDNSPVTTRKGMIQQFADSAEVIVAHDTEHHIYNYEPTFEKFKYRYDYKKLLPWTTAVSNTIDLQRMFEGL